MNCVNNTSGSNGHFEHESSAVSVKNSVFISNAFSTFVRFSSMTFTNCVFDFAPSGSVALSQCRTKVANPQTVAIPLCVSPTFTPNTPPHFVVRIF
jgi:hypothetical protein